MVTGSTGDDVVSSAAARHRVRHPMVALVVLALGAATAIVAQTLVLPVLPDIAAEYGISQTDAIWTMTVNLIAATVFSPLLGRLGDAWGRKRIMLVALAGVLVGSLIAAVATEFWMLLAGRVLQGTAFGVIALAISIVRDTFPEERVSLGIAIISAIMGVGGGAGLVIAGLLTEAGDFTLVFWCAAGAAAAGIALIGPFVTESAGGDDRSIDIPGALTLAGWLTCLILAIDRGNKWGWSDERIIGLFAAAAALLAAWVLIEFRVRVPLVDMKVFIKPVVLGTNLAGLLIGLGMFGAFTLINQFVQTPERVGYGFSADALEAGLTLLPMTLGTLVAAPLTAVLISKIGPKVPMSTGAVVTAVAFAGLSQWNDEQWHFLLAMAVLGLGVGLSMASMPQMLNLGVPHSQTGIANGMNSTLRELGSSTGSALAAAILSADVIARTPIPTLDAYETAFIASAVLALVAAVAAAMIPLRGTAAKLASQESGDTLAAGATIEHAPDSTEELVGVSRNGSSELRGRVVQTGGTAVSGAKLALTNGTGEPIARADSDARGDYHLSAAEAGRYVLVASANGYEPLARRVMVGSAPTSFDVTLQPATRLCGTVRDRNEMPVHGATISLIDTYGDATRTSTTDGDGRYEFSAEIVGRHTLLVSHHTHQPSADTVDVPEVGAVRHDVVLTPAVSLTGTISSAVTGDPIARAKISLLDGDNNHTADAEADTAGQYRFAGLAAGEYTVIATGYEPAVGTLHLDGSTALEYDVELGPVQVH